MSLLKLKPTALLLMIALSISISAQKKEIIGYFPEWAVDGKPPYLVKDLETTGAADKLTVINYSFCVPSPDSEGNILPHFIDAENAYARIFTADMSLDGVADDSFSTLRGQFGQFRKLKQRHPELKLTISIGGWGGSKYFSDAALTDQSREKFTDAVIDIYIKGNLPLINGAGGKAAAAGVFDGVDIDWEYPVQGGDTGIHNNKNDSDNLTKLFALFRKKLDAINPALLLTEAIPGQEKFARNYNVNRDQKYLNYFQLMTYDFRGIFDPKTGHHTNLLSSPQDASADGFKESFDNSVHLYRDKYHVSADKIVPGAAFYGKGWQDVDSVNNGLYRPGKKITGKYAKGFSNFRDLGKLLSGGFIYHWDNLAMAPFLYNPEEKIFWTLDNEYSIALKSRYVDACNLRGLMFWDLSGDDDKATLINTIFRRNMPDINVNTHASETGNPSSPVSVDVLNGNNITEGTNVIITAKTNSAKDSIIKIEFLGDGKSLGYSTKPPFSWVWFNIPSGSHEIKALITDNNGVIRTSKPISVEVQ